MPVELDDDDALREAAAHRGMKLVKSRRRKPGVGDFGRYGLTDAGGEALLGIGNDGLTATADEVRAYLRKVEGSTWAASAEVTPVRSKPVVEDVGPAEESAAEMHTAAKPRRAHRVRTPTPDLETAPEPDLVIRAAAKADLKAVAALLDPNGSDPVSADRFDAVRRGGGGVLVANRDGVIGCVAWHILLSLNAAPVGRITAIVVDKAARRRGVGRAMFDAAVAVMADQGCESVEAVGAIAVRNTNGFYRAMGLGQEGYWFVRQGRE